MHHKIQALFDEVIEHCIYLNQGLKQSSIFLLSSQVWRFEYEENQIATSGSFKGIWGGAQKRSLVFNEKYLYSSIMTLEAH